MNNKTLRDYLQVIFRHKMVLFSTIIIVCALTFFKLQLITPFYTASVKMLVKGEMKSEADYYRPIGTFALPNNHATLMKSREVLERVVNSLKLYDRSLDFGEKRLASRINKIFIDRKIKAVKLQFDNLTLEQRRKALTEYAIGKLDLNVTTQVGARSNFVNLIVKDSDPEMASLIANSISRSYLIFDLEQKIAELKMRYGDKNRTIIQLIRHIQDIYNTLDGTPLPVTESFGVASIKVVSQAISSSIVKPVQKKSVFMAAVLASLVIGITMTFIIELLDQTFKNPSEVESILNVPVLGSIPKNKSKNKEIIQHNNIPSSNYSRSYHILSDQISLLMKDKNLKTILIVDAENSADTPSIVANLGKLMSGKDGNRVLIIDANLRSPSVSNIFKINNGTGLIDVLEMRTKIEDSVRNIESNLFILPATETQYNPITLFDSSMFKDLIKEVKEKYEVVLISCADLQSCKDAVVVSSVVDGVVLVLNEGKTRRQVVKEAIYPLEKKQVNIVGAILNNRTYNLPGVLYRLT